MSTKPIAEFGVTHFKGISVKEKGAEGRYVLVPSGAVFPKHIKLDRCKRFTDDPAKLSQKFLQANDVLFNSGGVGTLGRSHHISEIEPKTYVPDSFVLVLRTNGEQLLSKYLYYYLQSPAAKQLIEDNTRGTIGITSIKSEAVLGFPIPCPSLVEQQRIVRQLDDVFEGIALAKANAEKNLQNARAIFESYLESVFMQGGEGWEETTLGEAFEVRDGTHDSPKYQPQGYPLVTSKNLRHDGLSLSDVKLISESDYIKINKRSAVHQGDVLFAMIGTIGNPIVVVEKPNFAIKNVALFKNPHGQSSAFLKHYLASRLVVNKMAKEAKGTTQKFVSLGYLREFPISIPPFVAQTNVVDRLERLAVETQKLTTLYGLQCSSLDAMKESLLRQSFSGSKRAA